MNIYVETIKFFIFVGIAMNMRNDILRRISEVSSDINHIDSTISILEENLYPIEDLYLVTWDGSVHEKAAKVIGGQTLIDNYSYCVLRKDIPKEIRTPVVFSDKKLAYQYAETILDSRIEKQTTEIEKQTEEIQKLQDKLQSL